jgi:flavin-dependent dehydrogenase
VRRTRFDALVIGGGPAGSVAALVLARGGARVALVDKSSFPRDKACGDMVGPRGIQLLTDLGLPVPDGPHVGDMLVVGPTGRRVRMPSAAGLTYPGHGTAVTRTVFDAMLHAAANEAGATGVCGRAVAPLEEEGRIDGYRLDTGEEIHADFVVGADGATSGVAQATGLVEMAKVLWGFAIRTYLPQDVELAAIVIWEPTPWHAFPGYGWVFPGAEGGANIGLGLATRADRQAGAEAVRVLLVGDAAGLINPLQGEGIAQGMRSGQLAAETLLAEPGRAAARYTAALVSEHLPYQRITAALQEALVSRPWAVAALARFLTAAASGDALAGGWAVFWNELLDGAPPGRHRSVATALTRLGETLTSRTAVARWFEPLLPGVAAAAPG